MLMEMFYLVNDLISMIVQDQIWIADIVNMYNMLTGVIVFILLICKRHGPSWLAQLFGSSGNNESGSRSSDAQANTPRIYRRGSPLQQYNPTAQRLF